jgi:D-alanyl-D-alanine carboxypeptidase
MTPPVARCPVIFRTLCFAAALVLAGCASGHRGHDRASLTALSYADVGAPRDARYAAIVVDAESGRILHAEAADEPRYPASLTKLMTLYILFEEIESGRLRLDTQITVSQNAARQEPTKLGLRAGSSIRVQDAIPAIAVRSSNDVAVAVAENIAGSEAAFAARMTRTAHALGMRNTNFRNPSGLPDPAQVTTARDLATLCRALQTRFPDFYRVFSMRNFTYAGQPHKNTNALLGKVDGMDGIKTGYIRASGYNLATSVKRNGHRINVVVFGGQTGADRNAKVAALVEQYLPERTGWFASR